MSGHLAPGVQHDDLALGQFATDIKSNEITAIPELLKLLDLRGAAVVMTDIQTAPRKCTTCCSSWPALSRRPARDMSSFSK